LFREIGRARSNDELLLVTMSGDGGTIVGMHRPVGADPSENVGVKWTMAQGVEVLEQHPAGPTVAYGVNYDGSLILGEVQPLDGTEAFLVAWENGVLRLRAADDTTGGIPWENRPTTDEFSAQLQELGIDGDWSILALNDASDDGKIIFGLGIAPDYGARFLLRLP
jgi:hypothetical protein